MLSNNSKDSLGDRQKQYEHCYRHFIPRNSFVAIRIDGRSFSSYTRGLARPFDQELMNDMDATTLHLCDTVANCRIGYVQSDEISLILSDREDIKTQPWFGNNLQKLCSLSSSIATAKFNQLRIGRILADADHDDTTPWNIQETIMGIKLAEFDSRVYVLPTFAEVKNYLMWRSQDATRNSISSVAQSLYSHKELHGVPSNGQQELIFQKGVNWNDYSYREKRGGTFVKVPQIIRVGDQEIVRKKWTAFETPINWFTESEKFMGTSFYDLE